MRAPQRYIDAKGRAVMAARTQRCLYEQPRAFMLLICFAQKRIRPVFMLRACLRVMRQRGARHAAAAAAGRREAARARERATSSPTPSARLPRRCRAAQPGTRDGVVCWQQRHTVAALRKSNGALNQQGPPQKVRRNDTKPVATMMSIATLRSYAAAFDRRARPSRQE